MVSVTPVYGFPFESASDQPGITLNRGEFGLDPLLAEAVEEELIRIEGDVSDNSDRITAVETLQDPPSCRVFRSTTQTLTHNAYTTIAFPSEVFDTASMHSTVTNNSRITATVDGLYLFIFHSVVQSAGDYHRVWAEMFLNGTTEIARGILVDKSVSGSNGPQPTVVTMYPLAVGEFMEVRVFQQNTAAASRTLSAGAAFMAARIGLGGL